MEGDVLGVEEALCRDCVSAGVVWDIDMQIGVVVWMWCSVKLVLLFGNRRFRVGVCRLGGQCWALQAMVLSAKGICVMNHALVYS